jgi:hypothetical protein
MRSRAVRVTLMLLAVAAIGFAAHFYWTVQTQISVLAERQTAFEHARTTAVRHAFELRSSQQAYVAAGQNEAFWFDKVTTAVDALRASLTELAAATTSSAAQASLEEASQAIGEFERRDRRVRGYVTTGQQLLASDVIFSDGLEAVSRILAALDEAGRAAAGTTATANAAALREQWKAAGAAAGVAMLAMLLLVPVRSEPAGAAPVTVEPAKPEDIGGLDLRPAIRRVEPAAAAAPPRPVAPAPLPALPIEVQTLASICTDLARLADTSTMPEILERTAAALDASGLVLWIADVDRKELLPIAAHGYAANVLSRMRGLSVEAENATAAAFRTGLLQTVSADERSSGAIAAPLVSTSGCLGVMSVEVRHDGEKQPARLAAASIVAAQLATLVGPPAARTEDRSTAAL